MYYRIQPLDLRFTLKRLHNFELMLAWDWNQEGYAVVQEYDRYVGAARKTLGNEFYRLNQSGRWRTERVQRGSRWAGWRKNERWLFLKNERDLTLLLLAV